MNELAKILLVEDEEEIAMLERDYLEINGYEVDILSDGLHAVERVLMGDYNLIILDLMLPGKNGYDICREIRDLVDIPILMVTAKTESVDKVRGLGLGADDYIAKPFDRGRIGCPSEIAFENVSAFKKYRPGRKNGK